MCYWDCTAGPTDQDDDSDQEMLNEMREAANLVYGVIVLHFNYPRIAFIRIRHTDKILDAINYASSF